MWRSLVRFIIYLGLRDKPKLFRFLAEIEYGVAIFCEKLQRQAISENLPNLARLLEDHGKQEKKHGKMWASLADGSSRIHLSDNGQWIEMVRPSGENIAKPTLNNGVTKTIVWDSVKFPGEQLVGLFKNFDGISKRYLTGQIMFGGRAAFDFSWEDKLAFFHLLEEETAILCQVITESTDDDAIRAIALQITGDELNHANYLKSALNQFAPLPEAALDKWRDRLWWAKWGLAVDIARFLIY